MQKKLDEDFKLKVAQAKRLIVQQREKNTNAAVEGSDFENLSEEEQGLLDREVNKLKKEHDKKKKVKVQKLSFNFLRLPNS